jgi:TRAP-type mannitol/chloroaromatic compound transport system permease small subunit
VKASLLTAALRGIDLAVIWVGRVVAWLTLLMVLVTVVVVVLRYFLGIGWIWLQESVTWMHATVFLLAAAYTLARDEHVRVDIFYSRWSPRTRAIVDTAGVVLLLLPTCAWIAYTAGDYVGGSWSVREASRETGGLPALYLLKTLIVLTPALLALEGPALLGRRWREVHGTPAQHDEPAGA